MSYKKSWPTIGYMNISLKEDWATFPWQGAVSAAEKRKVNLFSMFGQPMNFPDSIIQQANTVYELASKRFLDGLIYWKGHLSTYVDDDRLKEYLDQLQIPVVIVEDDLPPFPTVSYGNYEGIRMLIDHLVLVHDYTKIGFIGRGDFHSGFRLRFQAYQDGLKAYDLEYNPDFAVPWVSWKNEYNGRSNDEILDEWILESIKAGLKAVICMADPIAWWCMRRMDKLGLIVPDDLAVVSFDGFTFSKVCNPPLTTIDPNFTGLGALAVNTMVDVLEGKTIQEKIMLQPEMILARSCGCMEANVLRAAGSSEKDIFPKETIIAQIAFILQDDDRQNIEMLYDSFLSDINHKKNDSFLYLLEKILINNIKNKKSLRPWQDVITLFNKIKTNHPELAEELCHQARILINNASTRREGWIRVKTVFRMLVERQVSTEILTNFEISKLLEIIMQNLKKLGIRRCYLSLFYDSFSYQYPDKLPVKSKMILAFDENGRIELGSSGMEFSTYDVIPENINSSNRLANWTVFPLYFRENQIGFIIFEIGQDTGLTCEFLSVFISSSLQGVMLIDENIKAYKKLEQTRIKLQRELDVAKNIQTALLPKNINHKLFDISAIMKTAIAVGGDYYDIFNIHDRDWFVVGDVSGHGVHAGLIMMMAQTSIHLLLKQFPDLTPSQLLAFTNEAVRESIKKLHDDKYMTISALSHIKDGEFIHSGMHLPILIYRRENKKVEQIETNGMWLGILDDISAMNTDRNFVVNPGDCLLLYTDGLTEAKSINGDYYGFTRLINVFEAAGEKTSDEIINSILSELDDTFIDDDITLVAIKRPLLSN
ncbi:MAG: SpoIIE family protein phosphatase [Spirochaetales bacterium]|nr:SpoIIE family protein phosphatase [Spirochaetales bacterium]